MSEELKSYGIIQYSQSRGSEEVPTDGVSSHNCSTPDACGMCSGPLLAARNHRSLSQRLQYWAVTLTSAVTYLGITSRFRTGPPKGSSSDLRFLHLEVRAPTVNPITKSDFRLVTVSRCPSCVPLVFFSCARVSRTSGEQSGKTIEPNIYNSSTCLLRC